MRRRLVSSSFRALSRDSGVFLLRGLSVSFTNSVYCRCYVVTRNTQLNRAHSSWSVRGNPGRGSCLIDDKAPSHVEVVHTSRYARAGRGLPQAPHLLFLVGVLGLSCSYVQLRSHRRGRQAAWRTTRSEVGLTASPGRPTLSYIGSHQFFRPVRAAPCRPHVNVDRCYAEALYIRSVT